jgi:hypothetical protein
MSRHITTQLRELAVGRKTEPSVMIVARSASVDLRTLPSNRFVIVRLFDQGAVLAPRPRKGEVIDS